MFDFLAQILNFFYGFWPSSISYAMAIGMLTLVVLLVAMPLTFKQTKSMIAMQRLQPEVKALQTKHKDDRERLNQEMMALYQAHGVNPLGGCLPMVVQLPLFLVLFNVVRGITRRFTESGLAMGSAGFARGFEAVAAADGNVVGLDAVAVGEFPNRNFNPAYLKPGDEMYEALRSRNDMPSFGFDLSRSALDAIRDDIVTASPYLVLIVIVFVTSIIQQRQIRGRRSENAAVNPQQEMIMKFLPFMLPIFSFNFAAAVTVYFVISNLFRVGQQQFITTRYYSDEAIAAQDAKVAEIKASMPEPDEEPEEKASPSKPKPTPSGTHGSRRPTSRTPRKRRANDPKNRDSKSTNRPKGSKPVKPTKKSSGRVTPRKDSDSSKRQRGK